jgi:protease-4
MMMRLIVAALLLIVASGCGIPSFLVTPVQEPQKLEEQTVVSGKTWGAPKVAIIEVEGMLMNAKSGGMLQPGENKVSRFTQELELAAKDPAVKAVVLRVNSPGGTVTASDIMYEQVLRFKARTKKPVVAALQDVAASGAYYVSCAADRIVAHPTSVVGSIGVIFNTINVVGTMEKIGVKSEAIKSGPMKDMGSPFKELDPKARDLMQQMVNEYYGRFVGVVTSHRKLADRTITTDGRVFSGEQGVKMGLVDRTGLVEDAVEEAKSLAGVSDAAVIVYRRSYGYSGSVYASGETIPTPRANVNVMELKIPGLTDRLPAGFYYLWQPE